MSVKKELFDAGHAGRNGRATHAGASRFRLDASTSSTFTDVERLQCGYRYALALTHQPADAEDLVQEAWLNLSRRYGRVETNAVLFTAVRNLFVDQCRRKKIVQFDSIDELEPFETPAASSEEPGIKGDLEGLLAILRPIEREVLFLHYYQGHTAEEIGEITQQPRGTVLSLLHRALAKLREKAADPAGPDKRNQWLLLFVPFL